MFGLKFFFWPVLIDTTIHPCFKHAVSHVARVCAFGHLKPEQQNAIDHVCVLGEFHHSFLQMVSAKFGCFGWKVICSNVAISISAAILTLHCGLQ